MSGLHGERYALALRALIVVAVLGIGALHSALTALVAAGILLLVLL